MIYSGIFCTGKTTASKTLENVIELDSSRYYDKNSKYGLVKYISNIMYWHNKGYTVLCSSHKEVREKLKQFGIDYTFVTFEEGMLEEVMKRSERRQPHVLRTQTIISNWKEFIKPLNEEEVVISLNKECRYISNVIRLTDEKAKIKITKW